MSIQLIDVKGIGKKTLEALNQQNIWSIEDLVFRYPKKYETFTLVEIDEQYDQETITIKGVVTSKPELNFQSSISPLKFKMIVNQKSIEVIAFNRAYLMYQIKVNDVLAVKGKYEHKEKKIIAQVIEEAHKLTPIKPIYGFDEIADKIVTKIMTEIFDKEHISLEETIPTEYIKKYKLPSRQNAHHMIHLPKTIDDTKKAIRRFKYEEALFLQARLLSSRIETYQRPPKQYDIHKIKKIIEQLPYELTEDQKKAVNDIYRDFKQNHASFRLIQGDVGSGKTMVAAIAAIAAITANEQVSLMVPTELLANQHYQTFANQFKSLKIALLTGKTKDKIELKKAIQQGEYDLIIGTHALIESDVIFKNLGLVIIDEQHKFGVKMRDELISKAKTKDILYLTATPIPRSLALTLFGGNNVSSIKEKPKQRKPVVTKYILNNELNLLFEDLNRRLSKGEQAYIVAPAITSTIIDDNIYQVYEQIKDHIQGPIIMLHGQMKADEKELAMVRFYETKGSVLLATTMIEVGLDVPQASLIAIFAAEHFGLSQLHQLRGRVGRSTIESVCYLISSKDDIERLEILTKTNDGFLLSHYDLESRGPGDFLGVEQSGYFSFQFLNLATDEVILLEAQKNVLEILNNPNFKEQPEYDYFRRFTHQKVKL
jgi:ATP-dependent DNA helicase RecG